MAIVARIEGLASLQRVDLCNVAGIAETAEASFKLVEPLAALPGKAGELIWPDAAKVQRKGGVHRIVSETNRVRQRHGWLHLRSAAFIQAFHISLRINNVIETFARNPRGNGVCVLLRLAVTASSVSGTQKTNGILSSPGGGSGQ